LPSCVQEFFHWLEQRGINSLAQITPELIRKHYDYLSERPNYNRGGNLSDSMINHHIYALKTFMNYQEQKAGSAATLLVC
jgi:integrase/recombinase XerD